MCRGRLPPQECSMTRCSGPQLCVALSPCSAPSTFTCSLGLKRPQTSLALTPPRGPQLDWRGSWLMVHSEPPADQDKFPSLSVTPGTILTVSPQGHYTTGLHEAGPWGAQLWCCCCHHSHQHQQNLL